MMMEERLESSASGACSGRFEQATFAERVQQVKQVTARDPFAILGKSAAIFRAGFAGVEFPVKCRRELVDKAGGPDRLIAIPGENGEQLVYALLDLLEGWPELDSFFPMETPAKVAWQFAEVERRRKRSRKPSALVKIPGKHLAEITHREHKPAFKAEPKLQFAGFPSASATGAPLLRALQDENGRKVFSVLDSSIALVLNKWIDWVIISVRDQERMAALSAAARAEQQAAAAEAAAHTAQDAVRDVAGAPTNTQAQQAVDRACAAADQAARAAQEAINAAATACAHAGAVPGDAEAQNACSQARLAASRAQAAADLARQACERARDIASIGIVTICGHVNEEDPCCDDDVDGAMMEVRNVNYPEIPSATTTTDGSGRYCVTGRFGHSSRVGCSTVLVTMNSGASWGNLTRTQQIQVCTNSPHDVNFSFDAPGGE